MGKFEINAGEAYITTYMITLTLIKRNNVFHDYVYFKAAGGKECEVNMANVVHFNLIVEINELLKSKGIEYSIHSVGGCTCCGLELRQNGTFHQRNDIINIMNEHLSKHWLRVKPSEDDVNMLKVESKFDFED